MKHASQSTLDILDDLLQKLRLIVVLREKSRGVFYFRSKPFLHFHEDPLGLFADLKVGDDFDRFAVDTQAESVKLLKAVHKQLT
jgi:hypothetical protein